MRFHRVPLVAEAITAIAAFGTAIASINWVSITRGFIEAGNSLDAARAVDMSWRYTIATLVLVVLWLALRVYREFFRKSDQVGDAQDADPL
jgi:hypothetical protein